MDNIFTRRDTIFTLGAGLLGLRTGVAVAAAPSCFILQGPDGRTIDVHQWLPANRRRGLILFSHGAMSAPWQYDRLILPWVAAGYQVLAPLHVDSTHHPRTREFAGLASWRARIEDMRALSSHVGRSRYVAAGHSYGGLVALTLGGATAAIPEGLDGPLVDRAATAAIAFSPPAPINGLITAAGYGTLAVPTLIQTGTRDVPAGSDPTGWGAHLAAYQAAQAGGSRYALVLDGVDHYFGGAICRPDVSGPAQLTQLDLANRVALLFLAAYGGRDRSALAALHGRLGRAGPVLLLAK